MNKVLRVGMVGYGFMGKMHGHAYRSLGFYYDPPPARIELRGIATQSEASWQRAGREDGYFFGTADYRELCARPDVDIIDCCAPNHLHKDVVLCALENEKHVYVDKPLARTLDEAREIAARAKEHPGLVTQVTFQYRFAPAILRAKELIDEGRLGDLYSVRACYLHAGYVDPKRPYSWRLDPEQSGRGGALFDLGSHVIDLTRFLAGEFAAVHHTAKTFITERPTKEDPGKTKPVNVDDISILTCRMANGAIGTVESSRLATGVQDELRFEAHGSQGAIRFNLMQPNYLEFYDNTAPGGSYGGERGFTAIESVHRYPAPAKWPGPKNTVGWERLHVHAIHNFVKCIVEGAPASPDAADGAKTQAVLEAAVQSQDKNAWVDVPSV